MGARARAALGGLLERPRQLLVNHQERAGGDAGAARLRAIGLDDTPQG
jgi:hypothetical protein